MSSPDEAEGSVSSAGFAPECAERVGTLGFALGTAQSSEGEFPAPERLETNQGVMEAGGRVPRGCEGLPSSPANFEGATPTYFGSRGAVAIPQALTDRDGLGVHRNPSPESCDREVSTVWLDAEPGPSGRSVRAHGWVGSKLASSAPFHRRGSKGGQAWGSLRKGARYRPKVPVGRQQPSGEGLVSSPWSDSESSDEFSEIQLIRVSICPKGGGQAKPSSPKDAPRHSRAQAREKLLPAPGPCLSFTPRRLTSGAEKQAVGDAERSSKKPQSVTWGKAGGRPSCLPLVAAAGSLAKATPRRKEAQEMTSQGGASEVAPGSLFPPWGQRGSAAPLDPATFPPISGVPLLGRAKRRTSVPFGTRETKLTGAGQKSVAGRRRVSKPVAGEGEDKEPNRDPFPESQSPTQGQRPSFPDTGAENSSNTQDPAQSEPLALSQGEVLPSGPAPSSDQAPPEDPARPEGLQQPQQQQPPGAGGCPRCPELQREIRDLRQQLAAVRSLADTFRRL
ncbi:uncharacterized protein CXorf49 homolog [Pteronotus mesoamericanus]|uniref:uncharacterized protein CXorf49 homolog n=1 Tax=Pteronotus mesoamericanus TaxID=1884717 RepID=UPI0023EB8FE8|nr:uncharacterized protein CXorf49 homolog [Pteronotus parnellii mesoamericanus]